MVALACATAVFFTPDAVLSAAPKGTATLEADSMRYDPSDGAITASGNVRFKGPEGEVFGDWGSGATGGGDFEMRGSVRGTFADSDGGSVDIACDSIRLQGGMDEKKDRTVTAVGGVTLSRAGERLVAGTVVWDLGTENYSASGGVIGEFGAYLIDADKISRDQERFAAENVREYTDLQRRITLSAAKVSGIVNGGSIVELVAGGDVTITMPDSKGAMTRVRGDKGVFSVARGTLVVSGNTVASQTGRNLTSDSIVYDLDTGRVEAVGKPTLVFEVLRD
jgi:lipopolysaccharide export system protein LptA